jgi:hypothetical protein
MTGRGCCVGQGQAWLLGTQGRLSNAASGDSRARACELDGEYPVDYFCRGDK